MTVERLASGQGDLDLAVSDDDAAIVGMAPGAVIAFRDGEWWQRWLGFGQRLEVRGRADGGVDHHYMVNGRERPYEPEGSRWLATILPSLLRDSGFAADARVARLLRESGVRGIVTELNRFRSDWVRRLYVTQTVEQASLPSASLAELLRGVRVIGSDYELAESLIAIADRQPVQQAVPEFFDAVDGMGSDYERRRVLTHVLSSKTATDAMLAAGLRSAARLGSDYERASVLMEVAARHPLPGALHALYLSAARGMGSDYERGRALDVLPAQAAAAAPPAAPAVPVAPAAPAMPATPAVPPASMKEMATLIERISRMERELQSQAQSVAQLAPQLAEVRARLSAAATQSVMRDEIRQLEREMREAAQRRAELTANRDEIAARQAEIEAVREQVEALARALEAARQRQAPPAR